MEGQHSAAMGIRRIKLNAVGRFSIGVALVLSFIASTMWVRGSSAVSAQTYNNSVSQNGITWTFDGEYEVGQFYFGDWWVVGPVTIVSVSPGWDGTRHGSMIDPDPSLERQGYRINEGTPSMQYDDSLRVKFPITLSGITSLVSTIGIDTVPQSGTHPHLVSGAVLTVVNTPPVSGSFRPPYVKGNKPIYHPSELDYNILPRLQPPVSVPVSGYIDAFTKVYIDHSNGGGNRGATIHPLDNGYPYGRDFSIAVSHVGLMALLDIPEADEMARKLTQLGIDFYPIWLRNSGIVHGGGYGYGRKWPIIFAGLLLNNEEMQNPPLYREGDINKFPEDRLTSYGRPTADWPQGKPLWGNRCEERTPPCISPDSTEDMSAAGYRTCCSSRTWVGQALAAHIMGVKDLWNHEAYFDYVDRWISEPDSWRTPSDPIWGYGSSFIEDMWNIYRDKEFPPPPTFQKEDLNLDGFINNVDVQLCVNVILRREQDPEIIERADVNGMGGVNSADLQEIVNEILER